MSNFDLTPDFIRSIIQEIESAENLRRKRIAWDSEQIRTGNLKPFVEARIKQMYPKTWSMYSVTDYSILNKIVNKRSKAYKESPIRKVVGDDAATEIYHNIVSEYGLNNAMRELDIQFNQYKHGMVACFMDREYEENLAKSQLYWKFYSLAPYEYDVVKDDDGSVKVVILSYPDQSISSGLGSDGYNSLIAEDGSNDETRRERFYSFWTDKQHIMIKVTGDKGTDKIFIEFQPIEGNENGVNPYGVLPFVYVPMDYSKNYPTPSPLPMQTVELNALMSVYLTSANMQVGVLKISRPEKQKINISSHSLYTAIEAPQSSRPEDKPTDVSFISPNPNMTGHKEAIATYLSTILDEHGISGSQVLSGGVESFSSGFDRLLSQSDVQGIIEDNQEVYSEVEHEIYEIVAAQLSTQGMNVLPYDALRIVYRKPKVMISDKEKLDNLKTMKELGLWPDYELVQMYDPNLSEEDAKNKLLAIQQSKVDLATMFTDPSKVFNGAQVSAIVDVSTKVGLGQLTYEAGVNILITSFGIPEDQARLMVSEAGSVEPSKPAGV
jgi:hypothetical protein